MKNPRESTTLHALDRLPPGEAHEAESAIAQDLELARQLREVEDIAAHLWHASSPLHSVPPEIWEHIEREIQPARNSPSAGVSRTLLLGLGWAAALVLLLVLLFREEPAPPPNLGGRKSNSPLARDEPGSFRRHPTPPPSKSPEQDRSLPPAERKLRTQLHDLRERLARFEKDSAPNAARPLIVPLHPPGTTANDDAAETNSRVVSLITTALSQDLQRRAEQKTDLVIEQGWDPGLVLEGADDTLIRHRNFPETAEALEFHVSDDGRYYDPASRFVWTPAHDGGGYLGRRAEENADLTDFSPPAPAKDSVPEEPLIAENPPDPRGYVIEDPDTKQATLILDELPPQEPGTQIFVQFLNANGESFRYPLDNKLSSTTSSPDPMGVIAVQLPQGALISGSSAFSFTSLLPDGSTNVILSNGVAP